jgi:RNA polymerase sigma-70 factor, ECF subfamily
MADQALFLELFLQAEPNLRAFVGSLVRDRQARDDVFQEVALILWNKFGEYANDRSFGAWARGIAVNKVRQHWERTSRSPAPFSPRAMQAVSDAFAKLERRSPAAFDALEECLQSVPAKSRRLLQMRYVESRSIEDISAFAGVAVAAAYKVLARLRGRLRGCVEQRMMSHQD